MENFGLENSFSGNHREAQNFKSDELLKKLAAGSIEGNWLDTILMALKISKVSVCNKMMG